MNKKLINIAVDLTPILPGGENGGAKIFVIELIRQLSEMVPQTNFILLTQAASHDELAFLDRSNVWRRMVIGPVTKNSPPSALKGLAHRVFPHLPNRFRRVISRLGYMLLGLIKRSNTGKMLHKLDNDLLFCPFTAPTYFEHGIPTVCTIYDLQYKTYPQFFSAADTASRDQTFIEACRRATVLTAISNYSRQSTILHGKLDPHKIKTIYLRMAHRIVPVAARTNEVLSRLGLFPQQYLIYPANFWKHKNHEMLLTAFGLACHGGLSPTIKLVCTGAPSERQKFMTRAAQNMNLGDSVIFLGYVSNEEMGSLLSNSCGMVFPSLYEGFGLPVIEAMAAGIPVACSNTTSLPEVAANAAFLFDPRIPTQIANAIISLVEDESSRAKLVESGLTRAADFLDSKQMAKDYWDLFQYAFNHK